MFATLKSATVSLRCTRLQNFVRSTSSTVAYPQHAPKTKIVCTMGPAAEPRLEELVQAGKKNTI
jgi:hypothetical protein